MLSIRDRNDQNILILASHASIAPHCPHLRTVQLYEKRGLAADDEVQSVLIFTPHDVKHRERKQFENKAFDLAKFIS